MTETLTMYRKMRGEFLTIVQSLLLIVGTHQLKQQRALREAIGTRSLGFERAMLGVVAVFVVGLMSAAYLRPPADITQMPQSMTVVVSEPVAGVTSAEPAFRFAGLTHGLKNSLKNDVQTPRMERVALPADRPAPKQVTATVLGDTFSTLGYDFQSVLSGETEVPRLFLASLPGDLSDVREVRIKKALFLQSMLPLVLQVNEELAHQRTRALAIKATLDRGDRLAAADRLWLVTMTKRYKLSRENINGLLNRLNVVPVSLALAQAASESGWGTSRFVREGNALFGEWTFSSKHDGIAPADRDEGETHRVRAFSSLLDSVRAYVLNLNTHRAYRKFRTQRARLVRSDVPLDGHALAGTLDKYSERGAVYVSELRAIIDHNDLNRLDDARLAEGKPLI